MKLVLAFGHVLKKHRMVKGFSQEQLALYCDLDRTYIGMLERGQRQPSITTIFKLSEQLGVPPHKIIQEVEQLILQK